MTQKFTPYKSLVSVIGENRKGLFKGYNRDASTARVEFITDYNPETKERTVKDENVEVSKLAPYRKPKLKKYNPNEMYWMGQEFLKAFEQPYSEKPTPMDEETSLNRVAWSMEELIELLYATVGGDKDKFVELSTQLSVKMADTVDRMVVEAKPVEDILTAQVDALTDELYFNQGSFAIMGVQPFNPYSIVHRANMGKLHNGKVVRRESDGKVLKPKNWEINFAPERHLKAEIERQLNK